MRRLLSLVIVSSNETMARLCLDGAEIDATGNRIICKNGITIYGTRVGADTVGKMEHRLWFAYLLSLCKSDSGLWPKLKRGVLKKYFWSFR